MFAKFFGRLHERGLEKAIAKFGWTAVHVEDGGDGPSFAYSVGFAETLGAPEVYISGVPAEVAEGVIRATFATLRAGELSLSDGLAQPGFIVGKDCLWRRVHDSQLVPENFASALWRQRVNTGGEGGLQAFQLVWPDPAQGLFPWEPGCDPAARMDQRPLYLARDPDDPHAWWREIERDFDAQQAERSAPA